GVSHPAPGHHVRDYGSAAVDRPLGGDPRPDVRLERLGNLVITPRARVAGAVDVKAERPRLGRADVVLDDDDPAREEVEVPVPPPHDIEQPTYPWEFGAHPA